MRFLVFLTLVLVALPSNALICASVGRAAAGEALARSSSNPTRYVRNRNLVVPHGDDVIHIEAGPNQARDFSAFEKGKELVIGTFNLLNLMNFVGRYEPNPKTGVREMTKPGGPKDEKHLRGIAKAILENKYDVLALQEVESVEALRQFNRDYLNDEYIPLLIEGNDGRGIDVAILVKKNLGLEFTYESHRKQTWEHPLYPERNHLYSRDVTALVARVPGNPKPLFIMMAGHSKSKRTEREADPESYLIREGQGHGMADLAQYYRELYPGTAIFMGADFNAPVNSAPEYGALRNEGQMTDAFNVIPGGARVGDPSRVTHTFHPRNEPAHKDQLDAVLVSPEGKDLVVGGGVYRYIDENGQPMMPPDTYEDRKKQPSDHFPVRIVIDRQKLLQQWRQETRR